MNKKQLVSTLSEKMEISSEDALKCIDSMFNTIEKALANGEKVQLIGFGTFEVRVHHGREFINPATGQLHRVGDSKIPYFKAGEILKREIKEVRV